MKSQAHKTKNLLNKISKIQKLLIITVLGFSFIYAIHSQQAKAVCSSSGSLGRAEIGFNVATGNAGPHSIWIEAKGPTGAKIAAGVNNNTCTTATINMTNSFAWYKVNTVDLPSVSVGSGQTLHISAYTPGISIRNARIDTTVPDTPPPVNDLPVVSLQSSTTSNPVALASYKITANAIDSNGIASVEFYENNVLVTRDTEAPFEITLNNKPAGKYDYKAVATDKYSPAGVTTSAIKTVTVDPAPANKAPVVPIPTASTTSAPLGTNGVANIKFSVKPTDSDGTIRSVEFFRNGQSAGNGILGANGEFSIGMEFITTGSFNIAAKATDDKGASTTSGNINVNITNGSTTTATVLTQEIFDGVNLNNLKATQKVSNIDNSWDFSAPSSLVNVDTFSVRWTGKITAPTTGNYTFTTFVDDGVRLWVNGQQLVNDWNSGSAREKSGTISLTAGSSYDIKMEYYEAGGHATAQLFWTIPGSLIKQIVPVSAFSTTTSPTTSNIQPPTALKVTKVAWEWFDCKAYIQWNAPTDTSNLASYSVQLNSSTAQTSTTTTWKQNGIPCGNQTSTIKVTSVDKQGKASSAASVTFTSDCPWFSCKFTTR